MSKQTKCRIVAYLIIALYAATFYLWAASPEVTYKIYFDEVGPQFNIDVAKSGTKKMVFTLYESGATTWDATGYTGVLWWATNDLPANATEAPGSPLTGTVSTATLTFTPTSTTFTNAFFGGYAVIKFFDADEQFTFARGTLTVNESPEWP